MLRIHMSGNTHAHEQIQAQRLAYTCATGMCTQTLHRWCTHRYGDGCGVTHMESHSNVEWGFEG